MFIGYTDASVKEKKAYLAFVIMFEDKSIIQRRIVVDETDSNVAEALAITELLSFLKYYKMTKGILLFDSDYVKSHLKRPWKTMRKTNDTLRKLNIRTQVIPRKYNVAHRLSYLNNFCTSNPVSIISRNYVRKNPDCFLQLSVLEEYRQLYYKRFATFHEAQMKLNQKIYLADLIEEHGDIKIYEIHDKRIKVYKDTIIKLSKVTAVV